MRFRIIDADERRIKRMAVNVREETAEAPLEGKK
jgi:hypothetical protein